MSTQRSITREVKRDGSLRYKARISWQEGGRQRRAAKRFRTLAEAKRWQTEQEDRRNRGGIIRSSTRLTLNAHLDKWLAGLTDVSARTRVDYENITRRYWRPTLGNHRLDQITTPLIRETLTRMTADGLSPRTVQQARAILRIALGAAVDDGLVVVNAAIGRRMIPAQVRREPQVLSKGQLNALLERTADDPFHALWAVLLTTGLRIGEALALKWGDIDLDRAELRVQRVLVRPTHGERWLLEEPKTELSRRAVPLLLVAVEALRRHRDRQEADRLVAGEGYSAHTFVFATDRGEPLRADGIYKYHWLPTLRRLTLPRVRIHDCRHSAATIMLEAGLPMKVVSELLGHSTMKLTSDLYSHVLPEYRRRAAEDLAAYLGMHRATP